jgi:hypothetical protein
MNLKNQGSNLNNPSFNIPFENGKSALTEEKLNFTAREVEVFLVQQA